MKLFIVRLTQQLITIMKRFPINALGPRNLVSISVDKQSISSQKITQMRVYQWKHANEDKVTKNIISVSIVGWLY